MNGIVIGIIIAVVIILAIVIGVAVKKANDKKKSAMPMRVAVSQEAMTAIDVETDKKTNSKLLDQIRGDLLQAQTETADQSALDRLQKVCAIYGVSLDGTEHAG